MQVKNNLQCGMALDQKKSGDVVDVYKSNEKRVYSFLGTVPYCIAGGG